MTSGELILLGIYGASVVLLISFLIVEQWDDPLWVGIVLCPGLNTLIAVLMWSRVVRAWLEDRASRRATDGVRSPDGGRHGN